MNRPPRRRTPRVDPTTIADDLGALRARLDQLPDAVRILTDAATAGYPSTTSGADGSRGSDSDTQPERLAARPDRAAADARAQLEALAALSLHLRTAAVIIDANDRNRAVKKCTRCGGPWNDEWPSCRHRLDSGAVCMKRPGEEDDVELCGNPHCKQPLVTGQRSTWGKDGVTRCVRCAAVVRNTNGRRERFEPTSDATAGVARLELGTGSEVQVTT